MDLIIVSEDFKDRPFEKKILALTKNWSHI